MNIVYSSDDNYARHIAASMVSLLENNPQEETITFYILNVGLSEDNITKLSSIVKSYDRQIYFVDFSDIKSRLGVQEVFVGSFTIEMFTRLFLAEALPESEDRALWIDGDTSILGNIHNLYYCNMGENAIAAVIDQPSFGLEVSRKDAELTDVPYIASGMFVANLTIWRKEQISTKFVDYFKERNGNLIFPDQSVINHVLANKIHFVDFKYHVITPAFFMNYSTMVKKWTGNKYYSKKSFIEGKKHPIIVHYAVFRPWKKWCLHPMKRHYRKYLKMTPYKNTPLENDGFFQFAKKISVSLLARAKNLLHL